MPALAHALFYFSYAVISMAVGIALARVGGADSAGASLGGIALFSACAITHAGLTIAAGAEAVKSVEKRLERRIFSEIERMRAHQREFAADLDAMGANLSRLEHAAEAHAERRPEPQRVEAQLIDQLVDKLGQAMDARIEEVRRVAGPQSLRERGPIDIVREALAENRIELHLQPIVSLPQRRTVFYEGFTRLKDVTGRVVLPNEFMPAADAAGLMRTIDNTLLFRCVQLVRRLAKQDRRVGIFCNLSPRSLSDDGFFPHFLAFMHENRDLAGALIFEISQAAFDARGAAEARAMGRLAELGFRFSIDKVADMGVDLVDLERAGVKFLKAQARVLIEQLIRDGVRPRSNIMREISHRDVVAVLARHGVDLIAERIEDEAAVLEILEIEAPFAQGHLFGAPRAIKESLMEETAPPPGFSLHAAAPG